MLQITEIYYADKLESSNKTSNLGFSLPVHDNYYVWKKKEKRKTEQEDLFSLSNDYFRKKGGREKKEGSLCVMHARKSRLGLNQSFEIDRIPFTSIPAAIVEQ